MKRIKLYDKDDVVIIVRHRGRLTFQAVYNKITSASLARLMWLAMHMYSVDYGKYLEYYPNDER